MMNKAVFRSIPRSRGASAGKEVFPHLPDSPSLGFPWNRYFIDIRTPEDFKMANTELPERVTSC